MFQHSGPTRLQRLLNQRDEAHIDGRVPVKGWPFEIVFFDLNNGDVLAD